MTSIPFMDLKAQYLSIKPEIQEALNRVLDTSSFIMGPDVAEFESEFASYCGAAHCVGVGNGTDALVLALRAIGVGPGDHVVTAANTFIATAEAVTLVGAQVHFVDIDPGTFLLDPTLLERKVDELKKRGLSVKAVIAVHLYGQPCDMRRIREVANLHGLKVVEDAAQAHGAEIEGKRTGTLGDVACFSFYPGKNLGAYGDAGAVVTNNAELGQRVAMLRNHGRIKKYEHEMEGYNSRLDTLQAAVLRVKLKHLESWTQKRITNASSYMEKLSGLPVLLPQVRNGVRHVYHLFVIRSSQRDRLRQCLAEQGVSSGVHYPIPLHLQPAFASLGHRSGDFPHSEESCRTILSLPMDAEISPSAIEQVCEVITSCASGW